MSRRTTKRDCYVAGDLRIPFSNLLDKVPGLKNFGNHDSQVASVEDSGVYEQKDPVLIELIR
jgi:hypothetical protein